MEVVHVRVRSSPARFRALVGLTSALHALGRTPTLSFLPGFTRGVLGVAGSLLILFKRCIGLHLGKSFGILARSFLVHRKCLPGALSRALRLFLCGAGAVGLLSF